ncbi:hypothetical protein [Planctomycetes bacterium CA13]|uniref:hypothetical protein n=1 Tax=Novipirellula herctigrandis TaxID=2527986 RepID=UPI0011B7979A
MPRFAEKMLAMDRGLNGKTNLAPLGGDSAFPCLKQLSLILGFIHTPFFDATFPYKRDADSMIASKQVKWFSGFSEKFSSGASLGVHTTQKRPQYGILAQGLSDRHGRRST